MNSGSFRQLERLGAMGLQREGPPDTMDRVATQAAGLRHRSRTPMGRVSRLALQGSRQHRFHVGIGHRARRARPRLVQQPIQARGQKAGPPLAHGLLRQPQVVRHPGVALARRAAENHSRPLCQRLCGAGPPSPALQRLPLIDGDLQGRNRSSCAHGRSPFTTENAHHTQFVSIISGTGH